MKLKLPSLDDTPLTFGKYQGSTPNEIADFDPNYIIWMRENVARKVVTHELYMACVDAQEDDEFDTFRDDDPGRF